jgi:hypothetical protein
MPHDRVKENSTFDGREKKEKTDVKILQPRLVIVNSYTLIAALYCISSSILFFAVVDNYFLGWIHLLALLSVVANYFILLRTKNFKRATYTAWAAMMKGILTVQSRAKGGGTM